MPVAGNGHTFCRYASPFAPSNLHLLAMTIDIHIRALLTFLWAPVGRKLAA
jgi:hypothetical protein